MRRVLPRQSEREYQEMELRVEQITLQNPQLPERLQLAPYVLLVQYLEHSLLVLMFLRSYFLSNLDSTLREVIELDKNFTGT